MFSPRRFLAELSPITQRTASMMLDLPHPLGPTTAHKLLGKLTVVGSTNDLNPASLIHFKRIKSLESLCNSQLFFQRRSVADLTAGRTPENWPLSAPASAGIFLASTPSIWTLPIKHNKLPGIANRPPSQGFYACVANDFCPPHFV